MADDRLAGLDALLARLEDARVRLERADGAEAALPILAELHELSQAVAVEVDRQRRAAADEAEQDDGQLELG
ncbi:MAG: hypothetical protein AVDCRST_MAG79-1802 [uncultured Thermoleophilia bacterium]|uniref:Uncharacterized protein n=1 Tax=uncultured Thermoleophilia bacterium TaxID=1497501 RepID=A0A6J4U6H1_9ACTN|nr:MAG: hypothetical protein AVDCRST_MAG79-1802 [uncultured Thermoleophilia bacterium]